MHHSVAVGNLTVALRDNGMWHNTVLVFLGDNGGPTNNAHSNYPLKGGKLNWWEGGIRPAAFVSSPLLPQEARGRTFHGIVHETDWLPTFAALAGLVIDDAHHTGSMNDVGADAGAALAGSLGWRVNGTAADKTVPGQPRSPSRLPYTVDGVNVWPTLCNPGATR